METVVKLLLMLFSFFSFSCSEQFQKEEFVLVESGEYIIGSPEKEKGRRHKGEEDRRVVTVPSFYISATEITESEYHRIMGGSASKGNFPVVNVSWFDAVQYCNRRSEQEGYMPAYEIEYGEGGDIKGVALSRGANGYRLPTADEWEVACRAGTGTAFSTGGSISWKQANFNWQKESLARGKTLPKKDGKYSAPAVKEVRSYRPNRWGLYDMHGNVSEWCWKDGVQNGDYAIMKGGSWIDESKTLKSSFIFFSFPDRIEEYIGFRIVRNFE